MSKIDMNIVMDYVGLANIFEKKKCIVDGKKQTYYKKLEPCFGFYYRFNGGRVSFIVLDEKLAGEIIDSDSIYDFKTLNELCRENNATYSYDEIKSKYRRYIGEYYTLGSNNTLSRITDQELLKKIRGTTKEYDDSILNNDADISQMYSAIKKTIISQDEQIMQILTSLFKNQKVINLSLGLDMMAKLKENIIVYGSTGTGKTEILKRIANIGVVQK